MSTLNGHSVNGHASSNGKKKSWEFGWFNLSPTLQHLMKQGEVTSTDILIMSVIWAETKQHADGTGVGCFCSNSYLADASNTHERYVSSRISYLRSKGLLLVVWMNNRRYLEIEWCRTAEGRAKMIGDYGDLLRKEHLKVTAIVNEDSDSGKPERNKKTDSGKPEKGGSGKPEHKERLKVLKNNHCPPPPSPTAQAPENVNDVVRFCEEIEQSKKMTEGMMLAKELRDVLVDRKLLERRVNQTTLQKWAKEFEILINETSSQKVKEIFDWYLLFVGKKYIPECFCAASFREKFNKLVAAKKRVDATEEQEESSKKSYLKNDYGYDSDEEVAWES